MTVDVEKNTMEDKVSAIDTTPIQPEQSHIVGETSELDPRGTQRGLKSRHAQMIALGGTIGTGLFVGSGQGLSMGGPIFLLVAYILITVLVFGIVTATTEMSSYLPVRGSSMAYFGNRYVSPSLGFGMGWMYWYIFAITVPAEITATSLVIQYWAPPVHMAVWITIILLVIVAINVMPVSFYGEAEFWFASIKVFGIIGLIIMALVLVCGGGPSGDVLGFHYWSHPGPVNEYILTGSSGRLVAFVSVCTFSVFAFAFAPELLVVTGGEMESPRRNLPVAGKRYFYRLIIFYVLGAFFIGLIVSSDNPNLLGGGKGAGSSPWAVAAREAGIKGLDSVINAVIITSAWSAGNSYLYMASRSLYSMAVVGNAPRIFTRCTTKGVPLYAILATASISLLSYMSVAKGSATVFGYFVNLINTGGFMSWILVCFIYLRFRKATFAQGVRPEEMPYRSRFQPYMSYISGGMFALLLLLNGFTVFLRGRWDTSKFFTSYVGIPLVLAFYLGYKFTKGRDSPWMLRPEDIDITTGLAELIAQEQPRRKSTKWYHFYRALWE